MIIKNIKYQHLKINKRNQIKILYMIIKLIILKIVYHHNKSIIMNHIHKCLNIDKV
jgi:hypothetical protein